MPEIAKGSIQIEILKDLLGGKEVRFSDYYNPPHGKTMTGRGRWNNFIFELKKHYKIKRRKYKDGSNFAEKLKIL